ncbi:MAG: P-loop domain-containing protein [Pontiellaceae bacterium]
MKDKREFYKLLSELNGKPIEEYKQIVGDYDFTRFVIKCYPFDITDGKISPVFSIRIPQTITEIPEYLFNSPLRKIALEDYLLRSFNLSIENLAIFDEAGIAHRNIIVSLPEQTILPRNTVSITREYLEIRIQINLPMQKILINGAINLAVDGLAAQQLFYESIMESVGESLLFCNMDKELVEKYVNNMEQAHSMRDHLSSSGNVAFLSSGALLDREFEGDLPDYNNPQLLEVDEAIKEKIETPFGSVEGIGIPSGLTLIIGESADRESLINAISQGIYNHIPGDGREGCVTSSDAVEIYSEPGRHIQDVDISAFTNSEDNSRFTTDCATGFESQAAATVEALEAGSRVLLYDEDTSSVSFLTSDSRLNTLKVSSSCSLVSIARQMVDDLGISIIVSGSNLIAEYFPIANTVYKIKNSIISNITEEAKALDIDELPVKKINNLSELLSRSRWIMPSSIDPSINQKDVYIDVSQDGILKFGRHSIDVSDMYQIASLDQVRSIGLILYYSKLRYMDENFSFREILDLIDRDLSSEGLNTLAREFCGNLARPRRFEIASLINRLPNFRVSHINQ